MKLKNLVGDRFKERPADCVIDSHAFTIRGGFIKYVAEGGFFPFLRGGAALGGSFLFAW